MIDYVNENVNPKKKKTGDCVIRAIAKACGLDYYNVYEQLYKISIKTGYILNEKRVEDKLLEQLGFEKCKQPKKSNGKKYQISEIDLLVEPNDIVVIRCAKHLTCVIDYTLYDIWDCRKKTINNYYILKK